MKAVATHTDPESCVGGRKDADEALAGVLYKGAPVSSYSLTSGTGIDWANPMPEPATLSLLAVGSLLVARRRR